jgi:hypothetical protein
MKTKLTLIVTVLAAALLGPGCASSIWSEKDLKNALNENADFENGLQGWVIKEGKAEIVHDTESPFGGDKVLRLRISENGYARIESAEHFSFKPGDHYGMGVMVKEFGPDGWSPNHKWGRIGVIRFGPSSSSKVEGGYGHISAFSEWDRISAGFHVKVPKTILGFPRGFDELSGAETVSGPLSLQFRPHDPLKEVEIFLDNFGIIRD